MFFEDKIRGKLERCFDVENDYNMGNTSFELLASYNEKTSRYVLQKKNEIYAFEINQYILYKKANAINLDFLQDLKELLKDHCESIIEVSGDHMSSEIIFIIESDIPIEMNILNAIKKFKFYKSFKFGFEGWINGGLVVINPQGTEGISNKVAKKLLKSFLT